MVIVVMGPAGSGKSTVGRALASTLSWTFVEGDDHHPPANVARIAAGTPLTDADRAGWLDALHRLVVRALDRREPTVLACSALTAVHRRRLADEMRQVRFVYLKTPRLVLLDRLRRRTGHFAKASILDSQIATLEEPGEDALTVDGAADVETIVGHIRLEFGV
jgi:gluconokinase